MRILAFVLAGALTLHMALPRAHAESTTTVTPLRLESGTNGFELVVGPVFLPGLLSVQRSGNLTTLATNAEILLQTNTPIIEPLRLPVTLAGQAFFRTLLQPEPAVVVAATNLSSGGGTITAPPGSPIAGLTLEVPANSYADTRKFTISYTALGNRRLSDFGTPITPLINVDNGGGIADEYMALTIPSVSVASNEVVIASLLQHDTGTRFYVPVISSSNGTMTVLTRHFSSVLFEKIWNTIVTPFQTSFEPGVDDWDFDNAGTFVEPRASCYAMSQSAIWYFSYLKGKFGQLNGRFDAIPIGFPTPEVPFDNSRGLRFVGMLQRTTVDFSLDRMNKLFAVLRPQLVSNEASFLACYLQMRLTHQPQLIVFGDHAVVAYKADADYIYLADPNAPGKTGKLGRDGHYTDVFGTPYQNPFFIADTILADFALLPWLWGKAEAGTIGSEDFPSFQVTFKEQQEGQPVQIGTAIISPADPVNPPVTNHTDQISIDVSQLSGPPAYNIGWRTFHTNGVSHPKQEPFPLTPGTNLLGIAVGAAPELVGDRTENGWAGFAWITVIREGLVAPVALPATEVKTNGFTANWRAVAGADGYAIDVATNLAFSGCLYTNYAVGNGTNVALSGLSFRPATDYYYRLRASRGSAWSTNSNVISVRTLLLGGCDCPLTAYLVPELVDIPAGTFVMGSPASEPVRDSDEVQHSVTISRAFKMSKYEVTQAQYQSVMGNNPSYFTGDLSRPVEQVSWYDASNYCCRLTACEARAGRLPAGWVYRLPTEAEWEYACRAGTTTPFHYGNELRSGMANFDGRYEYPPCRGSTWYCYNPSGTYLGRTTSVGSYAPNAWGLYDMHGNVWEWCQDWYGGYSGGSVTDPQGPASGSARVIRGGGWFSHAFYYRSAGRYGG